MIPCDGLSSQWDLRDSLCFVWFLNMASAYRDMLEENVYDKFNLRNHVPRSYWLMGCSGPFGIIDSSLLSKIVFPLLKLDMWIRPKQVDGVNCGYIWCLFVYDLMQQSLVPYDFAVDKDKRNVLPITIGIGKTWVHLQLFSDLMQKKKISFTAKLRAMQASFHDSLLKLF